MKTKKKVLGIFIATWALSACTMLSFYPLYTQDVLIRDDRVVGTWYSIHSHTQLEITTNDTLIWEIAFPSEINENQTQQNFREGDSKIPNTFTYSLKVYDPTDIKSLAEFNIHLVQLGDQVFIDFFPEEWEETYSNTLLAMHLMGVHTFAKIEIGEQMQINWFAADYLEELIDENRIRLRHVRNGAYTLLTAKPDELQDFVIKYAGKEEAFSETLSYRLRRIDNQ